MSRSMLRFALAGLAFVGSLGVPLCGFAQDTRPSQDASQQQGGEVEHMKVIVTGVEGIAQVRTGEDQPWQKAVVGMELNELAEFRTGPKSAVRFVIPPDQTITLDRLGTVKVLQAISQDGKLKTNLGMKYGRTRYDIEAAGQEHESTIASPSSTLAVRGTKVSLFDQRPFPVQAVSLTGRAQFRDIHKQLSFGGRNAGTTKVDENADSAAAYAAALSYLDPTIARARSRNDEKLVNTLISRGSTVSQDTNKNLKIVTGGVPPTDDQLVATLPGVLNFVLRWTGDVDLNLAVSAPGFASGQIIYPATGLNQIPKTGAQTAFDHQGGPNGGIEIAYWPKQNYPDGLYGVGVQYIKGSVVANAQIEAYLNGQRVPITNFTGPTGDVINTEVHPGGTAAAVAGVNVNIP